MHYVVFLLRAGAIPYREIVDINLPGTYFFEDAGMRLFGVDALGLRLYDWCLLVCITAGCILVAGRKRWFVGAFAGLFFALVHFQDGLAQQGQRDLLMTALLLSGVGAFRLILEGSKRDRAAAFSFGLAFGVSFTIKPVLLPLAILLFGVGLVRKTTLRSPFAFRLALTGLMIPSVVAISWLLRKGAFSSFLAISRSLSPLHAALGRRSLSFLFTHSFSPLGFMLLCCFFLLVFDRGQSVPHRWLLAMCLAGTLLSYVVQGKGYPYQRYPMLAVLLLIAGFEMDHALDTPGKPRLVALIMLGWTAALGMYFAWRSTRYWTETPTVTALSHQLEQYGPPSQLNGEVQCLDMFGGCINTLYDLGIRQSTGFLYDCYLFTDPSGERTAYRREFWDEFHKARPRLIVVSSQNCFKDATSGYARIDSWPELSAELQTHYREVSAWNPTGPVAWFSQKQMPSGFKILVRIDF